jgi:Tfp pilus assembly ATPase PilU
LLAPFQYKDALLSADFRMQTFAQLQKDLERAQCEFTLHADNFLTDLAKLLEKLSAEQRAQLLYLIDLPENNKYIVASEDYFADLAEQIIHREALKVFWRSQFSAQ